MSDDEVEIVSETFAPQTKSPRNAAVPLPTRNMSPRLSSSTQYSGDDYEKRMQFLVSSITKDSHEILTSKSLRDRKRSASPENIRQDPPKRVTSPTSKLKDSLHPDFWSNFFESSTWKEVEDYTRQILHKNGIILPDSLMRNCSYCGNMKPLLEYMKKNDIRTMTTQEVRAWLKEYPEHLSDKINLENCDIDHVVAKEFGGMDHPHNYYLMPYTVNRCFQHWMTPAKLVYIGRSNAQKVQKFSKWCREQAAKLIDLNTFGEDEDTPVSDSKEQLIVTL